MVTVEPERAACVLAALRAGAPDPIDAEPSLMTGLTAGTVSSLAWPVLRDGLDGAVAVTDAECARAVADLAALGVNAGACGAAALAGARALDPRPGLGGTLVLLSTEGAQPVPSSSAPSVSR